MKRLLLSFLISIASSNILFAGTPHTVSGSVTYQGGGSPASVTFTAYVTTRIGDVLTQSSAGCGYSGGSYWVQCGNFSSAWTAGEQVRVEVSDGTFSASGTVTLTNDPNDVLNLVIQRPDINVSPASHNYGSILVGSSSNYTFTVSNTGGADLSVTSTPLSGDGSFSIISGGGSFMLSPGSDRDITVQFVPASGGAKSGTLTINSNDPDESGVNVALSGTGDAQPEIDVSPSSKNYGDVLVGGSSSQTFVVSNDGSADLSATSTSIIGDGDFTITSGGGSFTLSPGATRDVIVQFSPGSTGSKSATLRISNNDSDESTKDISLSGNGATSPDIDVAPVSKSYGSVLVGGSSSQNFTVSNTGGSDLSVTSTSIVGDGDFTITSGGGSFTLSAGSNRTVTVRFSPGFAGAKSATFRISSNDPDENPVDVALSGTGVGQPEIDVSPSSRNYGSVAVGSSSSHTFVVSNTGSADLSVTSTSIVGDGDFSITSGGGSFTLTPGSTRNVIARFAPGSAGSKSATLRLANNDSDEDPKDMSLSGSGTVTPDIDIDPTSRNFGDVTIGSSSDQVFIVSNTGTGSLSVSSVSLSGTNSDQFSIQSGGGSYSLDPGSIGNIIIRFSPATTGSKSASLDIASNDPDENPLQTSLSGSGTAVPVPDIAANSSSLEFENVGVGSSQTETVQLSNEGTADLTISTIALAGDDADQFSILSGGSSGILTPGATRDVEIQFAPVSEGDITAELQIQSNDPDEGTLSIFLNGTGVVPDIAVSPPSNHFGDVIPGSTVSQTFTITNEGQADLSVTDIQITGTDVSVFALQSAFSPVTLQFQGTHQFTIDYTPQNAGDQSATVQIISDDPDENPFSIPLSGSCVAPDIQVIPESSNFGFVSVGTQKDVSFRIVNTGDSDLHVTDLALTGQDAGEFSVVQGVVPQALTPSSEMRVDVRFSPTSTGAKQATLQITSDDPDENPVNILLTGNDTSPDIDAQFTDVGFGDVMAGSQLYKNIQISNVGQIDLILTNFLIAGQNVSCFGLVSGNDPDTLSQGESLTLRISFSPVTFGMKTAAIQIASNDPDENPFEITLSGTAIMTDEDAPYLAVCYPPMNSVGMPTNGSVHFTVCDDVYGIDPASLNVIIDGTPIVQNGQDQTGGILKMKQSANEISMLYQPASRFASNSTLNISVQCQDLSRSSNTLDLDFTWQTGQDFIIFTNQTELNPSVTYIEDASTGLTLEIPDQAFADTVTLGFALVNRAPALPDSIDSLGWIYGFDPYGLFFDSNITLQIPYTLENVTEARVMDPMRLPVLGYDVLSGNWELLTVSDYENQHVSVQTNRLGYFTLAKIDSGTTVAVEPNVIIPTEFTLSTNYPNPFNCETRFTYELPENSEVMIRIFDSLGRMVHESYLGTQNPGTYLYSWQGESHSGESLSSGIYFLQFRMQDHQELRKMLLVR